MLGTFFSITPENVASTTAYAGSLISDFMPLLVVLIGVSIGLYILNSILHR